MKILIHLFLLILLTTGTLLAQSKAGDEKHVSVSISLLNIHSETTIFDKIQEETESISTIKPLLFIGSIIESRVVLIKAGKEAIAAGMIKEGSR